MKRDFMVYVGSYTEDGNAGIHGFLLERGEEKASLKEVFSFNGVSNPSYLALSEDGTVLYSVMEDMTYEGRPGGGVASFWIAGDGVTLLGSEGTGGAAPCHLLCDGKRGCLYAANYMGGSVAMFRLNPDGSIGELCDIKQHTGCGPNKERQEGPHVHYVGFAADGEGLWCADLGLDRIKYYRIDGDGFRLVPEEWRDIVFPEGTGPRHFVLSLKKKELLYAVSELSSEVFVVETGKEGNRILQRISTLKKADRLSTAAAVRISADGRFLYASNRGDDTIAVFAVDGVTGLLSPVERTPVGGRTPRDFCLCDDVLLCANQDSSTITMFTVDEASGRMTGGECAARCGSPVCLLAVREE